MTWEHHPCDFDHLGESDRNWRIDPELGKELIAHIQQKGFEARIYVGDTIEEIEAINRKEEYRLHTDTILFRGMNKEQACKCIDGSFERERIEHDFKRQRRRDYLYCLRCFCTVIMGD